MNRGTVRNVKFESENKFEKLVHLVDFIIRIYHDARSHERQNNGHIDPTRRLTLVSAAGTGRSLRCLQHTSVISTELEIYFSYIPTYKRDVKNANSSRMK